MRRLTGRSPCLASVWDCSSYLTGRRKAPAWRDLGILKGEIVRIPGAAGPENSAYGMEFPVIWHRDGRLFAGISGDPYVYFVHSYYLQAEDPSIVKASAVYGNTTIHASVEQGNVFACQFHPEKSSAVGLKILKNFADLEKEAV